MKNLSLNKYSENLCKASSIVVVNIIRKKLKKGENIDKILKNIEKKIKDNSDKQTLNFIQTEIDIIMKEAIYNDK